MTIHDVAARAGVSTSTVSRVLNNRGYASEETIERVQQAVRDLTTLFLPPLLTSIEATFRTAGFNLLISTSITTPGQVLPLGAHNTDGILVFADAFSDGELQHFAELEFPMVLMRRLPPEGLDIPAINIENIENTRALITHLLAVHGCRRIAFLSGPEMQHDSHERLEGYRRALDDHGIDFDPDLVRYGGFSDEITRRTLRDWLDTSAVLPFDAIFAGDDEAAIAAIETLQAARVRVPEDVAVVGFDNDLRAPYISPALTTVAVPFSDVGREAARLLVQLVQGGEAESIVLPTEIVIRQSCGCQ